MDNASFRAAVDALISKRSVGRSEIVVSFDSKTAFDNIKPKPYVRNDGGGSETLSITEGSCQGNPCVCLGPGEFDRS